MHDAWCPARVSIQARQLLANGPHCKLLGHQHLLS